jgi:hypothetical protein
MSEAVEIEKEVVSNISPIATPLAGRKLSKKLLKLVKKGMESFLYPKRDYFGLVLC